LHAFMRSCAGFAFLSSAAAAREKDPAARDTPTTIASTVLMCPSWLSVEAVGAILEVYGVGVKLRAARGREYERYA
jgi:hypothetical protein